MFPNLPTDTPAEIDEANPILTAKTMPQRPCSSSHHSKLPQWARNSRNDLDWYGICILEVSLHSASNWRSCSCWTIPIGWKPAFYMTKIWASGSRVPSHLVMNSSAWVQQFIFAVIVPNGLSKDMCLFYNIFHSLGARSPSLTTRLQSTKSGSPLDCGTRLLNGDCVSRLSNNRLMLVDDSHRPIKDNQRLNNQAFVDDETNQGGGSVETNKFHWFVCTKCFANSS